MISKIITDSVNSNCCKINSTSCDCSLSSSRAHTATAGNNTFNVDSLTSLALSHNACKSNSSALGEKVCIRPNPMMFQLTLSHNAQSLSHHVLSKHQTIFNSTTFPLRTYNTNHQTSLYFEGESTIVYTSARVLTTVARTLSFRSSANICFNMDRRSELTISF